MTLEELISKLQEIYREHPEIELVVVEASGDGARHQSIAEAVSINLEYGGAVFISSEQE